MGLGQSQRTEGDGDQPEYQAPSATDYSVARAGTSGGESHNQPTVDHGNQPRHDRDDGSGSPPSGSERLRGRA